MSEPGTIRPVILCGGSGTRLWPASTRAHPKPFLPLVGDKTLLASTLARVEEPALFSKPIVVAGRAHAALVAQQLGSADDACLIVEPCAKNTAPAIALAAHRCEPDEIMLVCPSDHHIADEAAFRRAVRRAAGLARENWMVALGIAPSCADTGYGYIARGETVGEGCRIARFVEKPEPARAEAFFESGQYSWNGGIFAFRASVFLEALQAARPEMASLVQAAVGGGTCADGAFHPAQPAFEAIEAESVDYAVMEGAERAAMVEAAMGWSDIGNWASLHEAVLANRENMDEFGNVAGPRDELVDCRNVMARSDGPRISAIGLENVVIVVNDGEVLVTTHDGAQKVGRLGGARSQ